MAFTWSGVVETILVRNHNRTLNLKRVSELDLYRLLSIRTWALKYRIPAEEIIKVLIDHWDKIVKRFHYGKKQRGRTSLGVKIHTFCGDKAEQVIIRYIKETYAHEEHIQAWRSKEQQRYLTKNKIYQFSESTLKGFVKAYKKKVKEARKQIQDNLDKGSFTKRRFPGNPWI